MSFNALLRHVGGGVLYPARSAERRGNWYFWRRDEGFEKRPGLNAPMDRMDSGLLISEEFARLDLQSTPKVIAWYTSRGPLWVQSTHPVDPEDEAEIRAWSQQLLETVNFADMDGRDGLSAAEWEEILRQSIESDPYPDGYDNGAENVQSLALIQTYVRRMLEKLASDDREPDFIVGLVLSGAGEAIQFELEDDGSSTSLGINVSWRCSAYPIYLQLAHAWSRAIAGLPAGEICKACDQPFLILDGRRATYCNNRCRSRFNMRAMRARRKESSGDER